MPVVRQRKLNLSNLIRKNPVPTPQTNSISNTKTDQYVLFEEIIGIDCENNMKYTYILGRMGSILMLQ